MFEKYKFIEKFRMHHAAYLMVDVDPQADEYDLPPGELLTPKFLCMKSKPVPVTVDAFLKKFVELCFDGAFPEIQTRIEPETTGIKKSNMATVGHVLSWEYSQLQNKPDFQMNPNEFYPIELTRQDLAAIAGVMGLNPAFLQESEINSPAPANEKQKPEILPIHTAQNVTWKHIFMTVRNYEITEIKHPGGIENKLHKEMGLKQRGKGPLPGVLLQMYLPMAALNGCLPAQGNIEDIKGNIHRLRQCFKSIFPNISGDPIPFINNEYQTAFTLRPDPENFFNQMPDPTKDYVTTFIKAANRIKIK